MYYLLSIFFNLKYKFQKGKFMYISNAAVTIKFLFEINFISI